jgi:hypothetical protein
LGRFFSDFGRQNAGRGAQDAKEAHLTILIESRSKRRSVGGYSVSGALVGLTRHGGKETVSVTAGRQQQPCWP